MGEFQLFPVQASSLAPEVDHLLYFLLAVTVFFTLLIFGAIFYFAIRYRRRSEKELPHVVHGGYTLEILWSVIPFGLTMVMFTWGASVFFAGARPPDNAMQIYAVGKQWMWKLEHMEGVREINELHVPVGRPIRITMASEDVIHSFYVPAFRTKQDVVPGRYTTTWFTPTKVGKYHLFCAEYCGTRHSGMIGWVYVMEPRDYENWLGGGAVGGSLAENGKLLFEQLACSNCHKDDNSGRCPTLVGLFGKDVQLSGGGRVKADEAYLRESILQPQAKIVAGYEPVMPTFTGLVNEDQVVQLVEYVKSLGPKPVTPANAAAAAPRAGSAVPAKK
ncbi:MAG TPA: cytochrome c oxidase subunit II [Candidatus Acidoferrales bacterium]|nr:cytochrome c oxidase subunit II [Candidatus Acidoferrales bacterium]